MEVPVHFSSTHYGVQDAHITDYSLSLSKTTNEQFHRQLEL